MRELRRALLYASIQLGEGARNALDQHWTQGVVMSRDLVLIPDFPDAEDARLRGAHVLVVAPGSTELQRVAIRGLELMRLDGKNICGAALLDTRLPPVGRRTRPSSPAPLIEAIRAESSVWPALLSLVPDGSGPGTDPALFLRELPHGIPEVPVVRVPRRTDFSLAEDIGKSLCWFVPWCQPDGPL